MGVIRPAVADLCIIYHQAKNAFSRRARSGNRLYGVEIEEAPVLAFLAAVRRILPIPLWETHNSAGGDDPESTAQNNCSPPPPDVLKTSRVLIPHRQKRDAYAL
jgi:hypothetical protein